MEKLSASLRGVGACRLRYAVFCGVLFVLGVRLEHSGLLRAGEHG